ncbi:MAG TPA: bifunctional phosphoribosylaminoimidazolecarboxamide formyltransferase/IMP cyclohydrolase, partial [Candidatus Fraserbacteria bacterium]|nr:bifunctional phosphoribosylaminoimidazolecarboxamide formyltransferase/IMP cyclohydrolase [Candidatus Fraserbacteria bacterium]
LLLQEADRRRLGAEELRILDNARLPQEQIRDLLFAFAVCKHVKSNAIVIAQAEQTLGIGAGQMNRVQAVRLALAAAAERAQGAVLASDGFFPFADSIGLAAEHGIKAIIQPGGSVRDEEVFAAARAQRMAMVLSGVRHFRH